MRKSQCYQLDVTRFCAEDRLEFAWIYDCIGWCRKNLFLCLLKDVFTFWYGLQTAWIFINGRSRLDILLTLFFNGPKIYKVVRRYFNMETHEIQSGSGLLIFTTASWVCFAMNRLVCSLNLWKRIDYIDYRNENLNNWLLITFWYSRKLKILMNWILQMGSWKILLEIKFNYLSSKSGSK